MALATLDLFDPVSVANGLAIACGYLAASANQTGCKSDTRYPDPRRGAANGGTSLMA
jgi:hypothetical protein